MNQTKFTNEQVSELIKQEPRFDGYVKQLGLLNRVTNPNVFESIVEAMVSQQISGKVAAVIMGRLVEKVKTVTPNNILNLTDDEFQTIGLGPQKRGYIRSISTSFLNEEVSESLLKTQNEQEVIEKLTKLKGVGEWTAEMLLIFSLGKTNVLSHKDLGIRKGLAKLYEKNIDEITKEFVDECKNKFSPHNTLASFYLWEIATIK